MADSEIGGMKIKDLFEVEPILTGRTQIDTIVKLTGTVWSTSGLAWHTLEPDVDDVTYNSAGFLTLNASEKVVCPIEGIPNGAKIKKATCFGSETDETWDLRKIELSTSTSTSIVSGTAFQSTASDIDEIINNQNFAYYFVTDTLLDATDIIYGCSIEYENP